MENTKQTIIESIKLLNKDLKHLVEEINSSCDDRFLVLKNYRGSTHFYLKDRKGESKYLDKTQGSVITEYAQKRYLAEVRVAAEAEIGQLEKCLSVLEGKTSILSDINQVYDRLPEVLKRYVEPDSLTDEAYARQWQESNTVVKRKRIHAEDDYHRYKTIRGDYVGSKSEVLIADRLFAKGIPYHYEIAFTPEVEVDITRPVFDYYGRVVGYEAPMFDPRDRDTLHPDFYVLNKRTRKAYYWEHLGKLNDENYCKDNLNRIIRALDAGYTIGKDILITHEDSRNPLRLERIDEIIKEYLS